MKLINIWSIASAQIRKRYLVYISSIILTFICMLIFSVALFAYVLTGYGRRACNRILIHGTDKAGVFEVAVEDWDEYNSFLKEVNASTQINAAVYLKMVLNLPGSEEIRQLQTKGDASESLSEDEVSAISATAGIFDLFQFKFEDGGYKRNSDDVTYIYLGANLASVPVGTKFQGDNTTYEVAGILKKNSKILDDNFIYTESDLLEIDYTVSLDNMVVCCDDVAPHNWVLYSATGSNTREECWEEIQSIAQEYGVELETNVSVDGALNTREVNNAKIVRLTRNLWLWIFMIIIVVITCNQIADTMDMSEEYGILYSCGCSCCDIMIMGIFGNVRRTLIAGILWFAITALAINNVIIPYYETTYMIRADVIAELFYKNICPWMGVFAIANILLTSVLPIILTGRIRPAALIGGYKA